ncbi:MAG TPA: VOC family protein [Aquamicrobium sp.]|nr:VOC family protein [Aquamicrobium sp.]
MPSGILESALYVDDLDKAEAFYGGVLGLERISRVGNRHVFFRCGDGVLLLFNPAETVKPPAPDAKLPVPPHGTKGEGHLCFRATGEEIERFRAHLESHGVAIEADFHWPPRGDEPSGGRSIYFRDPAGNSLEIAEPRIWGLE